ncbi:sugar-binding domain-containing protein [Shinella sp. DD12]|uniref:sugar-binding domain-containing protein n=1 Tax=Shinella sp. DD12 TaxID=1410620 RepID=UPI0003C5610A|nr:sugar-binding domain-containing protein [Shinella sp. DD12]EYR78547.1 transcriptional regulator [Shinella sp. DD12]
MVQVTGASAGNRELSAEFCVAIMAQSRRRRRLDLPLHRRRGRQITDDFNNRVIGTELDDLLSLPRRLCVADDANKTDAIRAVLKGGHATHLVTHMASTEQ